MFFLPPSLPPSFSFLIPLSFSRGPWLTHQAPIIKDPPGYTVICGTVIQRLLPIMQYYARVLPKQNSSYLNVLHSIIFFYSLFSLSGLSMGSMERTHHGLVRFMTLLLQWWLLITQSALIPRYFSWDDLSPSVRLACFTILTRFTQDNSALK